MSWERSYGYSGGQGIAGWHMEDGFVPFIHHVPLIEYDWSGICKAVDRDLLQLLSGLSSLSGKTWVLYKGVAGSTEEVVTDILRLNGIIGSQVGVTGVVDELLVARRFFFRPEWLAAHDKFMMLHQLPGMTIVSGLNAVYGYSFGHQVSGFSMFSFACNLCFAACLVRCLDIERLLSDCVRFGGDAYRKALGVQGHKDVMLRSFVSGCCIVKTWMENPTKTGWLHDAVSWLFHRDPFRKYTVQEGVLESDITLQCESCGGVCACGVQVRQTGTGCVWAVCWQLQEQYAGYSCGERCGGRQLGSVRVLYVVKAWR